MSVPWHGVQCGFLDADTAWARRACEPKWLEKFCAEGLRTAVAVSEKGWEAQEKPTIKSLARLVCYAIISKTINHPRRLASVPSPCPSPPTMWPRTRGNLSVASSLPRQDNASAYPPFLLNCLINDSAVMVVIRAASRIPGWCFFQLVYRWC